jgi:hypothetical protein
MTGGPRRSASAGGGGAGLAVLGELGRVELGRRHELRPIARRAAAAGGVGLLHGLKRAVAYCRAGWAAAHASC